MRILSFGGGVQTTALSILVAQGKVNVDAVVFADTGCEKPETYWYMDTYIKPLYQKLGIPFHSIKATANWTKEGLYQYCLSKSIIPDVKHKWCSKGFKALPISRQFPECTQLIGFSVDEAYRSDKLAHKGKVFPLIEMGLTSSDCQKIIEDYGLALPVKSSCYICPFQHPVEWNWLKLRRPELFQKALDLEARYHERKPHFKSTYGLLRGTPLWRLKDGIQPEMFQLEGESCWSGYCSH